MHGVGAETRARGVRPRRVPAAPRGARAGGARPRLPDGGLPEPGGARRARPRRWRWRGPSDADLVLANDPDADRLGVADPRRAADGGWRALTGDEIGSAARRPPAADRALRARRRRAPPPSCRRACSSKLADEAGVAYGEALTGFKWVVRTPAPGQRFVVRLRGGARATASASSSATRTASPPRSWPPTLAARLRAEGSSLGEPPRRARPRATAPTSRASDRSA